MKRTYLLLLYSLLYQGCFSQDKIKHFIYFGLDREAIKDTLFLKSENVVGAQIRYFWKTLEPQKNQYDFSAVEEDRAFLARYKKQLFIQVNDATFDSTVIANPAYLMEDPTYNSGADPQYDLNEEETTARKNGWAARRWDPAVRKRFQKLFKKLGKRFDGKIAGINLQETALSFGKGKYHPRGFTYSGYRDGLLDNMRALRKAFRRSVCIQYANFMPGEFLLWEDSGYLKSVYEFARENDMGVGGPDILVYKKAQMNNSYGFIRESSGRVWTGVAVQDGNYDHINPQTGNKVTVEEIYHFAKDYLKLDYIFWCTEAPYYKRDVLPFLKTQLQ